MIKIFRTAFVVAASLAVFSSAYAEGGCGWGAHRGPYGGCRANGGGVYVGPGRPVAVAPGGIIFAPVGRACPYGYHLGPQGRRCWRN